MNQANPINPKLSSIAARVRALQAKSIENGATEAEALAAAAKARELLDKYQLDMTAFELRAEGTFRQVCPRDTKGIGDRLAVAIGKFCDCKIWYATSKGEIYYLGLRSDSEFAGWLHQSLVQFVERGAIEFLFAAQNPERDAMAGFVIGATGRISQRLKEAFQARHATVDQAMTRGALVVAKQALIAEAFAAYGIRLGQALRHDNSTTRADALASGQQAGNRASFARPLGHASQAQTLKLIGRG